MEVGKKLTGNGFNPDDLYTQVAEKKTMQPVTVFVYQEIITIFRPHYDRLWL